MSDEAYMPPAWDHCHLLHGGRKVCRDKLLNQNELLHHFLPWHFALKIFQRGSLRLYNVRSWTDPYEEAWCKLLFQRKDKLSGVNAYGLCWTKSDFDEPMWRMAAFKRRAPIIRISCHVNALVEAGCRFIENNAGSFYIGNVNYRSDEYLYTLASTVHAKNHKDVSRTACGLLLQKRVAFRFEDEVRILWFNERIAKPPKVLILPIDPSIAIAQVMTSPYATNEQHKYICDYLKPFGVCPVKSEILEKPKL